MKIESKAILPSSQTTKIIIDNKKMFDNLCTSSKRQYLNWALSLIALRKNGLLEICISKRKVGRDKRPFKFHPMIHIIPVFFLLVASEYTAVLSLGLVPRPPTPRLLFAHEEDLPKIYT
jgi:hypothetical protein